MTTAADDSLSDRSSRSQPALAGDSALEAILADPLLAGLWSELMPFGERAFATEAGQRAWAKAFMKELGGYDRGGDIPQGMAAYKALVQEGRPVSHGLGAQGESRPAAGAEACIWHFPGPAGAPFVLVLPGGGYGIVATPFEGFPLAAKINQLGYSAFVLRYRTSPHALAPAPQDDAANALRFILEHAPDFRIQRGDFALLGFSAGGHLAASCAAPRTGFRARGLPNPSALILGYPVVSMGQEAHAGSRDNLLGPEPSAANIALYSVERQIDEDFPPTYIVHGKRDDVVPFANATLLKDALDSRKIRASLRIIDTTVHGFSLGEAVGAGGWVEEALGFWSA